MAASRKKTVTKTKKTTAKKVAKVEVEEKVVEETPAPKEEEEAEEAEEMKDVKEEVTDDSSEKDDDSSEKDDDSSEKDDDDKDDDDEEGEDSESDDSSEAAETTTTSEEETPSKKRKSENDDGGDDDTDSPSPKRAAVTPESKLVIHVHGLPWEANVEAVEDYFSACGKGPTSVELPPGRDGRSSGRAVIKFETQEAAEAAVKMDGNTFTDSKRWLGIKFYEVPDRTAKDAPRDKPEGCVSIFVGNLTFDVTEENLRTAFKDCGAIAEIRMAIDRRTGEKRGFGHVDF